MKNSVSENHIYLEYKGYHIFVYPTQPTPNPRETDNIGIMHCHHTYFYLPKESPFLYRHDNWNEYKKDILKYGNVTTILPVYMSNIYSVSKSYEEGEWGSSEHKCTTSLSTEPLNPKSEHVGFIYADEGWNDVTKKRKKKLNSYLCREVEMYGNYLLGNVFDYKISHGDKVLFEVTCLFEDCKHIVEKILMKIDDLIKYMSWYDGG